MSNSLQNLVPVLDGANYRRWADLMKAYLQSQGVWILIELPDGFTEPTQATDGSNRAEILEWIQMQSKAMGSIRLRLSVEVAQLVRTKTTAKSIWNTLYGLYGGTSTMGAFAFFKAAINVRIPANEHPGPAIAKIQSNLDELDGAPPALHLTCIDPGTANSRDMGGQNHNLMSDGYAVVVCST